MGTHSRMEFVAGGWRFFWARGGSFVMVLPAEAPTNTVPYDMMALPEWVNASKLDVEGFQHICRLYVLRASQTVVPR